MRAQALAGLLACLAAGGCGATPMRVASLDELEQVRTSDEARSSAVEAPAVYARAEHEREAAREAHARGDDVAANLHAEYAIAAYGHARTVARLAHAVTDLAESQKAVDDATAQEQALATTRAKLEIDAQDLERRAEQARDRLLPPSGTRGPTRDVTRASSARSLAVEARLLCGAARLVSADAPDLADAEGGAEALETKLSSSTSRGTSDGAALADAAGAARARCLDVLTRARRLSGRADDPSDALLAELSATGGWDPTRDERGIVVTLRGTFAGVKLTPQGEAKFRQLGRVAAAHPGVGLQIVVHDAQAPEDKAGGDPERADVIAKTLVAGGAQAGRVKTEEAGARDPAVDPNDVRLRARNERVDVVFVSSG